ncbi:MAG TPA: translocation/assembly module TamB domain-containing protein [Chitinophagaceae bacterium]|nr:translocation/assembly module TamB domain-containing protein [Chitinophagaceae bacterium]
MLKELSLKRFKKILLVFLLSLLLLIVLLWGFLQTRYGQNWVGRQVVKRFSRELQTRIQIRNVQFSLFNRMHLEGVVLEDRTGDTVLYAEHVRVRITDWFFLKKEAVLKYINLEDGFVKFQRTDSIWQQQFIFDYFAPDTSARKKKAGIRFDLKEVELRNMAFIRKDGWLGEDMTVQVGTLKLDARKVDFSERTFAINNLEMTDPLFSLANYRGRKPPTALAANQPTLSDTLLRWNSNEWFIQMDRLTIRNGRFRTDRVEEPRLAHFDGRHLDFSVINAELNDLRLFRDTIYSRLELSARERSGLEVKKLSSEVKLTPQLMAFTGLDLETNRSRLREHFEMRFSRFSDMSDFVHKVNLFADLKESRVHSADIAFFAPGAAKWDRMIGIEGRVRGTVDALVGRDLRINAGNSTVLNGDLSLTGLPNINQTFIDLRANDLRTTYSDLARFVPAVTRVRIPDLRKLHSIQFTGNFTGFPRDFVTFGTIRTNLGTVQTDLNMKLPPGHEPVYSGTIATSDFRLGTFLNDPRLGAVSIHAELRGSGFSDARRSLVVDGRIRYLDYNNYRYQNLVLRGKLEKRLFDGFAEMRDENADFTLNGVIDFNRARPSFDFIADVREARLKNLRISREDLAFRGKLNLNFTGDNLDNFIGFARVTDAELTRNGMQLPFDSLVLSSYFEGDQKVLSASSNEFTGILRGQFRIAAIPDAFQLFLNRSYPSIISAPRRVPENQDFEFDITTQFVEDYVQLVDSSLSGFNYSRIYGRLDLRNNQISLTAEIPQFRYRQYRFESLKLDALGSGDSLRIDGLASRVVIGDSLNVPNVVFHVRSAEDLSRIQLQTGDVDKANLNATVHTFPGGVKIDFEPSSFTVNGKTWIIDESGELEFRDKHPTSGQLVLREGDQRIVLQTVPSGRGRFNDLKIQLTKVNIGDISPYFIRKNRLEGLVSGNLLVEDPAGQLRISSQDLHTEFLRLDNDSLGEARATLRYDDQTRQLRVSGSTVNQENFLGFEVDVYFDEEKEQSNVIALTPRNFQISVLERFLGNLFSDIQGYLTGNVDIRGAFDRLRVTGRGRLRNAGLKVNFTQVFYRIEDRDIQLTENEIDLDGLVLRDTITGNPVYVRGGIQHDAFRNMFYDLDVSTRRPRTTGAANNRPVMLLNTAYRDNKQFYGKAFGTGSLSLTGPQSDMFMKIDAIASQADSSEITITSTASRVTGLADFLVERKYGREMEADRDPGNETSILYDVDVTANNRVAVRFVIDELTGDEIKGRGSGSLNITSGTTEPLSIRGRYDIEEGNYLFTFQSFFKKPFELKKGLGYNNYIEWNGDPNKARIHFDAVYTAERISFLPLGSFASIDRSARSDVYVIASLRDELFKPTISFALDFPPASPALVDPELALVVQQMQKQPGEMTKQVAYLIVFNSFAPYGETSARTSDFGLDNSISGILLDVISDQLNRILNNLFKNDKFRINVNTAIYNRNLIDPNGTSFNLGSNVNISVGRAFFNDRFIITIGGGFDAPLQQSSVADAVKLLPDVTMEWLINQSGSLRVTFFYRENTDYLTTTTTGSGRAKRYGSSLTFRKDGDSLWDLFRKRKKAASVEEE